MSIKSTRYVTREKALEILMADLPLISNDALATLLDSLSETHQSHKISYFDNFIVTNLGDPTPEA